MKIIYFQDPKGNFGDELNRWLWPRIFGEAISGFGDHGKLDCTDNYPGELLFYGIGTILDNRIPQKTEKIIFGSGFGYGEKPQGLNGFNILFVRGAKTAQALSLPPEKALTDPAILLRHFFPLIPDKDKSHDISFIPHHSTAGGDSWRRACEALNIHYIDPRGFDIETVVMEISASRLVIAEAMHGAIVADTFRVPWIPVSSVPETNDFKWEDWCGTLGLSYGPARIIPVYCNTGNKLWKTWLNKIKQFVRVRQLTKVVRSRSGALLSDNKLLDAHRAEMDLRVQALQDYLIQRSSA